MSEPENIRKLIAEEAKRKANKAYIDQLTKTAHLSKWANEDTKRQFRSSAQGFDKDVDKELEAAREIFNKERREKLRQLYEDDKQRWQEELGQMGLAFVEA
jgi:aldehyde:ferredoxin oxidoreductase